MGIIITSQLSVLNLFNSTHFNALFFLKQKIKALDHFVNYLQRAKFTWLRVTPNLSLRLTLRASILPINFVNLDETLHLQNKGKNTGQVSTIDLHEIGKENDDLLVFLFRQNLQVLIARTEQVRLFEDPLRRVRTLPKISGHSKEEKNRCQFVK